MNKLKERLIEWADENITFRHAPITASPDLNYLPVNKISFWVWKHEKLRDLFKNPFYDYVETIELNENWTVIWQDIKKLECKRFCENSNLRIFSLRYDKSDHAINILLKPRDKRDIRLLNIDLETTSKNKKTLAAKKDLYLYWMFNE